MASASINPYHQGNYNHDNHNNDDDGDVIQQLRSLQIVEEFLRYQTEIVAVSTATMNGIVCSRECVQNQCIPVLDSIGQFLKRYKYGCFNVSNSDQDEIKKLHGLLRDRIFELVGYREEFFESFLRLYKEPSLVDIDKLWDAKPIPYNASELELSSLARTNLINIDYYNNTLEYATTTCSNDEINTFDGNVLKKQRNENNNITSTNLYSYSDDNYDEDGETDDDNDSIDRFETMTRRLGIFGTGPPSYSVSLLPNKHRYAKTWYRVIPWIIPGITISDWDSLICNNNKKVDSSIMDRTTYNAEAIIRKEWIALQKCIHGINWNRSKRRKKRSDHTPALTESNNSIQNNVECNDLLGIENFSTNHIWLALTASNFFDRNYTLMIIPILTIEQVQQWNGMVGYNAIFVIGTYEGDIANDINDSYNSLFAARGCSVEDYLATVTDIQIATELLRSILCHLAVSNETFQKHKVLLESLSLLDDNDVKIFNSLANWNPNCPDGHVMVPTLNQRNELGPINVRKAVFRGIQEPLSDDNPHHEAPDPMLLLLKAATVWSHRQQQPLLGGTIPKEDINYATSDEFSDTNDSNSTCSNESFNELEIQEWNLHHLMEL